jgi:hypothetical protein
MYTQALNIVDPSHAPGPQEILDALDAISGNATFLEVFTEWSSGKRLMKVARAHATNLVAFATDHARIRQTLITIDAIKLADDFEIFRTGFASLRGLLVGLSEARVYDSRHMHVAYITPLPFTSTHPHSI